MTVTTKISADFPFKSHFLKVDGSKIHYVDEGKGDPVVFIHGIPTYSYLWRNVIPEVSKHARCIAPDLIGMGLSDKPDIPYSIFDHIQYITKFLDALDLHNITFVLHGWGAVVGFHYAMQHKDRIKSLVFYEAHIRPKMTWDMLSLPLQHFLSLVNEEDGGYKSVVEDNYLINTVMPSASLRKFTEKEMEMYRKPFQTLKSRRPLWQYFQDLPKGDAKPSDVIDLIAEYSSQLRTSQIPKLMFYAVPGFMTTIETVLWAKENLPNLEVRDLGEAMHFAMETDPETFTNELLEWYLALPVTAQV